MKLYTDYTRIELLEAKHAYLVEDRVLSRKLVSAIPVEAKLIELDPTNNVDSILIFKNTELDFNYKYKTIILIDNPLDNPNILGIIDIEGQEDITCNELIIKVSITINYVTSDLTVNISDVYKLENTTYLRLVTTGQTQTSLNLFDSIDGESYNMMYTHHKNDYYEVPFAIMNLDSDINLCLNIKDVDEKYLYIETKNHKYLFDGEFNKLYKTYEGEIYGYDNILVSEIVGLNYEINDVWYNIYGTIITVPIDHSIVYTSQNNYDVIFYEDSFQHISGIAIKNIILDETLFKITSSLVREFYVKSMLFRFYGSNELIVKTTKFSTILVNMDPDYAISSGDYLFLKTVDGLLVCIYLDAVDKTKLVVTKPLTLLFCGRNYNILNNCIYLYE